MRVRTVLVLSWASLSIGADAALASAPPDFGFGAAAAACFGAAARDVEKPCANRALSFTAVPTPYDAPLEPSAPCTPIQTSLPACAFGVAQRRAAATVSLIGDSHSTHWRAALTVVASAKRWHGVSINRDNCPFTVAKTPRRAGKNRCAGWTRRVVAWHRAHPEVHAVVVSANSGSGVVRARGLTRRVTKINGYVEAWKALPRSVREIFVIRDVPHSRNDTSDCVTQAIARHRKPAVRCARPRSGALLTDLEAVAAQQADADRVKLIDLTQFMCDQRSCFPVVGGALVIKDIGHLTRTFSASLGPFLGRAISRLQAPAS
jgi:hypothetical protein